MEDLIRSRWGALPAEQRSHQNYISNVIIKMCSDEASCRSEKVFLSKLNDPVHIPARLAQQVAQLSSRRAGIKSGETLARTACTY